MPPQVQTVSELTGEIKDLIEGNLPEVWVRGEVSNCLKANSGHVYFTLKDEGAQIAAVMWRNTAARFRFDMHDGLQVVVNGSIEVYKPRGSYQVIVRQLIPQELAHSNSRFGRCTQSWKPRDCLARLANGRFRDSQNGSHW